MIRVVSLLLVCASIATAQVSTTVGRTFTGDPGETMFGYLADHAGDLNGDFVPDYLIAAQTPTGSVVRVYSGLDGTVIHQLSFGWMVTSLGPAGDVNADGTNDFIVGAADFDAPLGPPGPAPQTGGVDAGRFEVYSGADASVLGGAVGEFAHDLLGHSVAGAGDVNGDGHDDYIVSAIGDDPTPGGSMTEEHGEVRVYSGFDHSILWSFQGTWANNRMGEDVGTAGDVNFDAKADVLLLDGQGTIRVYSVAAAAFAWQTPPFSGALEAECGGDVDWDGIPDIVSSRRIFSGLTGAVISFLPSTVTVGFGRTVATIPGDVNGDGFDDVLVSREDVTQATPDSMVVFSGEDGTELHAQPVITASAADAAGAGDLNGDGFRDFLVGNPLEATVNGTGTVRVLLAPTLPTLSYGTRSGFPHFLKLTWSPDMGDPLATVGDLACTGATPFGAGFFGASLVAIDFLVFGFLPLVIANDPINLIESGSFSFDGMGEIHSPALSRQIPALAGWNLHLQFFETLPIVASSNGLRLLLIP